MFETIVIWTIIAICAFFTGRRFYRQWRTAISRDTTISCVDGCTCCNDSSCTSRQSEKS